MQMEVFHIILFGFGVTGNGSFKAFSSWDQAIDTVGSSIASSYGAASTPLSMERAYCPPSFNSDHHWAREAQSIMNRL